MEHIKSSSKREIQETRKISDKPSNLTPEGTRKRITKPNVNRKKEIIKIRVGISETENRKSIGKKKNPNETKSWFFEKINKINKSLARLTRKKKKERERRHKLLISETKERLSLLIPWTLEEQ